MLELYHGSTDEVLVQQKAAREAEWTNWSKGAAHSGYRMAADAPDVFGWRLLLEHLHEDQSFGFRLIAVGEVLRIRRRLAGEGFKVNMRESFIGTAEEITEASSLHALRGLPKGLRALEGDDLTSEQTITAMQHCIATCGLAPLPGAMLAGQSVPSLQMGIVNEDNQVVATGFAHRPHNQYSPHTNIAYLDQICVAGPYRKQGLGRQIAAQLALKALEWPGIDKVYADVEETDLPARTLVERTGLTIDGALQNGEAVPGSIRL